MTPIASDSRLCTGCLACLNVCPQDAVVVTQDALGRTVPMIATEKCSGCGRCARICPANSAPVFHPVLQCLAAYSKDEEDRRESSSGGLAAILARRILDDGGVVFGAAYDARRQVAHVEVAARADVACLRGSKYAQSDVGLTYRLAQRHLRAGRKVLYVGTPCQIDGLVRYLGADWPRLVAVDLVCHGTPPAQYLAEHLRSIRPAADVADVAFRGARDYHLTVSSRARTEYCQPYRADTYFQAFMDGLSLRENCYHCPYAHPRRVADVTLGDFWKLDRSRLQRPYAGKISLVLINTAKGMRLWEQIRDACHWVEVPWSHALPGNAQLNAAPAPDADRPRFERAYPRLGFEKAVRKTHVGRDVAAYRRRQRFRSGFAYRWLKKIRSTLLPPRVHPPERKTP